MKRKYSIIQVLLITFVTLILSLLVIVFLVGEVRQELLRIITTSIKTEQTFHIPPAFGYGFLALAIFSVIFLLMRMLVSLSIPHLHEAHQCPKCDSRLQRIHRKTPERWLSTILLLPVGRYGCINCEWNGLRRHHRHRDE